ncbi:hypothetical protein BJ165DRAFT_1595329 [Panaeolus papilionaceus]|nr:hypothetical protein BJ165DRAFT_1595329 [Panaeolus papilionaceus]
MVFIAQPGVSMGPSTTLRAIVAVVILVVLLAIAGWLIYSKRKKDRLQQENQRRMQETLQAQNAYMMPPGYDNRFGVVATYPPTALSGHGMQPDSYWRTNELGLAPEIMITLITFGKREAGSIDEEYGKQSHSDGCGNGNGDLRHCDYSIHESSFRASLNG